MSDPSFTFPTDTAPLDTFEGALVAWVVRSTGIPAGKVILARQDGPRPAPPFAEVGIVGLIPLGAVDAKEYEILPSEDALEDVRELVRSPREMPVLVRIFTSSAIGPNSALALALRAQSALGLTGTRDALGDAGVTVFDLGNITPIPAMFGTKWEGRAQLDPRFYVELTTAEVGAITYIKDVELTNEEPDPDHVVTVEGP